MWGDDRKLSAGPSPVLWWRWWEHLRRCEVGKLPRKYLVRVNKAKMTYRCDPNDPNNTYDPNDSKTPK